MAVSSTIQRYFTHHHRDLDKDDIRIIYKNLQAQDIAIAEKFKKAAKTKRARPLRAWLDLNGIESAVRDLLDDENSGGEEGGFKSDVGEESEQDMVDAEEAVSGLKKGPGKQKERGSKLKARGKHIRSMKALHLASRVAVGDATSQMTSALAQEDDGSEFFQMTASCAPLQGWVESFEGIEVLDVGRGSLYPDGSHVHAEMRMLAARLRVGKGGPGTQIIVSKPCCPVCFDVLTAFGWIITDPAEKGEYFKDWGNPFEKKDEAAWFNKADKAAQKHSEHCKIHKPF